MRAWSRGPVWAVLVGLVAAGAHAQATDPAVVGRWSVLQTWPQSAVHAHLLPTGKVLWSSEFEVGEASYLWDPATDALTPTPPAGYNIFCAGHAFLPDGRLLLAGGHLANDQGLPYATLYDPTSGTWSRIPDMNTGRWYPTATTLPEGDILVVAGAEEDGSNNTLPQVWEVQTGRWRNLTSAVRAQPYYPWMFVAPDGRVFDAGPDANTAWLQTAGTGAWTSGPRTRYGARRTHGSAVMYDVGKVLISGGDGPPTNSTEVIDLNVPSPAWRSVGPMRSGRKQHNLVSLPDGTVLVVGGHSGATTDDPSSPRFETELWSPATETWSLLAPISDYRGYHGVALLLPDGRVLSAGGRGVRTMQVFSPPYLFKGPRPVVTDAPAGVGFGQAFTVQTPDAARVARVTALRLGSTTHAFDENARFVPLAFTRGSGQLTVSAPPNARLAPPGHYMLFVLDGLGVPSVARIVRFGGGTAPPPPPPPPGTEIVAVGLGSTWRYDDRNVDPGPTWTQPGFDDAGWRSGPAQLGYGDADEATRLTRTATAQPSVYFRRTFTLHGPVSAASLRVLHDDGVAVWVNGVQVFSRLVGSTAHGAYATSSSADNQVSTGTVPTAPFVVGANTLAVMVKQSSGSSSDLSFDLELRVTVDAEPMDAVMLEAPNGGETLRAGSTTQVRWMTHGSGVKDVRLEYSPDGGATWSTVVARAPNTGAYTWTVPTQATTRGLLRLSDADRPEVRDVTDAPFTISDSSTYVAVAFGEVWRFHDANQAQPAAWTGLAFDDTAWRSGPAQLGYGDGDERTVLADMSPNQPSVYFRKRLSVLGAVSAAALQVRHDDGVAVWVNGTLVFSRYVDAGLAHGTYASASSADNQLSSATLPAGAFRSGDNVVAVMVKQSSGSSTDLSFDLELTLTVGSAPPPPPPTLTVTAPNGGETLTAGAPTTLRWTSAGDVGAAVDLTWSADDGATWTPVASGVANTGSHPWTVPATETTRGRVRVMGAESGVSDVSDAAFTIARATTERTYTAIPLRSTWRYDDTGVDRGTAWLAVGYVDTAWKSGAAQLGYGDGDEATLLRKLSPSLPSFYFRHRLAVTGRVTAAQLRVVFDDAVAVWVNGTLVYSRNMLGGTGFAAYAGTTSGDNATVTTAIPAGAFVAGDNVVAVMVKQQNSTSSDVSFDLELVLTTAE